MCRRNVAGGNAIGTRHKLLIRRPNDHYAVRTELCMPMKRQKCVEDRQSPVRGAQHFPCLTDMLEHFPFVNHSLGRHGFR
jgi:hypothetical protein